MSWSFYSAQSKFQEFAEAWDNLNNRLFQRHPLFDSLFVAPLVKYFATEQDMLAFRQHDSMIDNILLLTPRRCGIWSTFLPAQTQVSPVLVSDESCLPSLLPKLPGMTILFDWLCQDPDYCLNSYAFPISIGEFTPHATTINISLKGTFENYWQSRPKKLRQNLRRKFQKARKDGYEIRFDIINEDPTEVEAAFNRYAELESQSWKASEGTAIQIDNIQGDFYKEVLIGFTQRKKAIIYELYFDEQLASSQFTIANDFMLITLKTTYDTAFANYSPGRLLDYMLLEHEFASKRFNIIEYYTNATPEQISWGTAQRNINHYTIYRFPWIKPLIHVYRKAKESL